jgi:hypothetical protein
MPGMRPAQAARRSPHPANPQRRKQSPIESNFNLRGLPRANSRLAEVRMTKQIQLTQGKFALVDDEDYCDLSQYKWSLATCGYAQRGTSPKIYMHRQIMNAPTGMEVDHINGNRADNRKSNLRLCSHQQNLQARPRFKNNSSGFRGVNYEKKGLKHWRARIELNGKKIDLGLYIDPRDAAIAYNNAARIIHGEFARLNEV